MFDDLKKVILRIEQISSEIFEKKFGHQHRAGPPPIFWDRATPTKIDWHTMTSAQGSSLWIQVDLVKNLLCFKSH